MQQLCEDLVGSSVAGGPGQGRGMAASRSSWARRGHGVLHHMKAELWAHTPRSFIAAWLARSDLYVNVHQQWQCSGHMLCRFPGSDAAQTTGHNHLAPA
jgi:hypothetical protein